MKKKVIIKKNKINDLSLVEHNFDRSSTFHVSFPFLYSLKMSENQMM